MKKKDIFVGAPVSLFLLVNAKMTEVAAEDERREAVALLDAQAHQRREKYNLKHGLKYAQKIWRWVKDVRNSDFGKKMMWLSHIPTVYHLVVFWDGYANNKTDPYNRNWFSLAFGEDGLIRPLYGRMFTFTKFSSANELSQKIPTDVLEKVCAAIDDGSVWKRIEKGFDYLKEKK